MGFQPTPNSTIIILSKTYRWYEDHLAVLARFCTEHIPPINTLDQVTAALIGEFVAAAPTSNTHTRHARAQVVKGWLSWCARDAEMGVKSSTVSRIEMPKVVQPEIEVYTPEDIARLLRRAERTAYPHRNRALILVLLDTGVRASELCFDVKNTAEVTGLRMEGLYLSRGGDSYIRVMGKDLKARTIGLGQETTLAMRRYLNRERGENPSPFVFLARGNEPLSVRMLQRLLQDLGERAGVPDCHAHRFRHTYAVNQLLAGTSDLVLMKLLGHTSLEATKVYTRAMSQTQARRASVSVVDQLKKHPSR